MTMQEHRCQESQRLSLWWVFLHDMQESFSPHDEAFPPYCRSMQAGQRSHLPDLLADDFGLPEPAALAGLSHRQCMGRLHMLGKEAA